MTNMNTESIDDARENAKAYFLGFLSDSDDFTQLGYLTGFLRDRLPNESPDAIRTLTQSIIKELMEIYGVYVVDIWTGTRSGVTSAKVMKEIEEVFRETNGVPDVGDGIWFGID